MVAIASAEAVFTKHFDAVEPFAAEVAGYNFMAGYHEGPLPQRHRVDADDLVIEYEHIGVSAGAQEVSELFVGSKPLPDSAFAAFEHMSETTNRYAHTNTVSRRSGSDRYFDQRLPRLESDVVMGAHADFVARYPGGVVVDGRLVPAQPDLIPRLSDRARNLFGTTEPVLVHPSQGDVHDKNILTNGYVVDFEAAGWNAVTTDASTLIFHALVAANHFGPQYARWATIDTVNEFNNAERQLVFDEQAGELITTIDEQRFAWIDGFYEHYVANLAPGLREQLRSGVVADLIAYRLLTTFEVGRMSTADGATAFALAGLFMRDQEPQATLETLAA